MRARLAAELGGLRGSAETALPIVVFTVAYLATDELRPAIIAAVATAVGAYGLRLAQRSEAKHALNGLVGMVFAAVLASLTGRAETAFLPGIIQSALWAVAFGVSLLVRRPAAGFVVGAVIDDLSGWREHPAIMRLSARLTLVLLVPAVVRVAVQLPLYLAGEVGWLGVSRVVLGWPLHAATLAVAGLILLRGRTPLRDADDATPSQSDGTVGP